MEIKFRRNEMYSVEKEKIHKSRVAWERDIEIWQT